MNQETANELARRLLPGWTEVSNDCTPPIIAFHPPDGENRLLGLGAVVNTAPNWDGASPALLTEACVEAQRLYRERCAAQHDKVAASVLAEPATPTKQPATKKPADDWSFTASTQNPPHLGRILREAREHGVRLLRVRCGEASRVFVERELAVSVIGARAGLFVDENDGGRVLATEIWQPGCLGGRWCMVPIGMEHMVPACQRLLANRREVKVEVLG